MNNWARYMFGEEVFYTYIVCAQLGQIIAEWESYANIFLHTFEPVNIDKFFETRTFKSILQLVTPTQILSSWSIPPEMADGPT